MSTQQELFEKVARHLFTQGQRSGRDRIEFGHTDFVCCYQDPEGRRCAVGCLMTDEVIAAVLDKGMNQKRFSTLPRELREQVAGAQDLDLLQALQSVHDAEHNWVSTDAMRQRLNFLAHTYKLDASFLDGLKFESR